MEPKQVKELIAQLKRIADALEKSNKDSVASEKNNASFAFPSQSIYIEKK